MGHPTALPSGNGGRRTTLSGHNPRFANGAFVGAQRLGDGVNIKGNFNINLCA